jgi:hypothetical protein
MKPSTRYLISFFLLITLLIFLLLASNSATYATQAQIEQALATITLTRTSTPDGRPVEVAQGIAAVTNTPTRTPTPINIGNFVWDDLDGDGRQDAGELGLAGVSVQLWNSAKNDLIDSAITSASGSYTVTAPLPGNYRIRVLLPNASDEFSPKDMAGGDDLKDSDINPSGTDFGFTDSFNLASNVISITTKDAGIKIFRTPTPTRTPTPINVGNFVWDDVDGDGNQDAGEPGMSGITVQLWNSAKNDLIDSAITSATGIYSVTAPLPGDYRIRVLLPSPSDQFSPKNMAGGDDLKDSDVNPSGADFGFTDIYTFGSNLISITTIDAGIIRYRTPTPTRTPTPINVGNLVWNDLDGDGNQDAGEPGLGGITVQLWNSAKTQLIHSAVTNASGLYTLIAPTPGDYRVRVLRPTAGDQFTIKDSLSATDQSDSDINATGINLGFTDVYTFASNLISITTIDAGLSVVQLTPTPSNTPTATPTPHPPNASPLRNFTNNYIVEVSWSGVTWATGYTLQVDNNANFSSPEYSLPNIAASERSTFALLPYADALYYWRVGAKDAGGAIHWSTVETFTINIP